MRRYALYRVPILVENGKIRAVSDEFGEPLVLIFHCKYKKKSWAELEAFLNLL